MQPNFYHWALLMSKFVQNDIWQIDPKSILNNWMEKSELIIFQKLKEMRQNNGIKKSYIIASKNPKPQMSIKCR